jgi:hypothetical protein
LSAKLVGQYGKKVPLPIGLGPSAAGLLLFARSPMHGHYLLDVLPSMLLLGLGAGMALNEHRATPARAPMPAPAEA